MFKAVFSLLVIIVIALGASPAAAQSSCVRPIIPHAWNGVTFIDGTGYCLSAMDLNAGANTKLSVVSSNSALMLVPSTIRFVGMSLYRSGFTLPGDGGAARYTYSASACSISGGDGGTQVPALGSGCWIVDPSTPITIELFAGTIGTLGDDFSGADVQPALQKALNTGQTVNLARRNYLVLRESIMKTRGQIIQGQGRGNATNIYTTPSWVGGSAMLRTDHATFFNTGAEGPAFRDFYMRVFQPEVGAGLTGGAITTALASLVQISCIDIRDTIAVRAEHMMLGACIRGIDARGATGMGVFTDIKGSNFNATIDIDGALDTVTINDIHDFPYAITANQYALIHQVADGIRLGKMDDIKINGGMSIASSTGIHAITGIARTYAADGYTSPGGIATGAIVNFNFDILNVGLKNEGGHLSVTGGYNVAIQAIYNTGALTLANGSILVNSDNAVDNNGSYSYMAMSGMIIDDRGTDFTPIHSNGRFTFAGNNFVWSQSGNTTKPKVLIDGGVASVTGNMIDVRGSGTVGASATWLTVSGGATVGVSGNVTPGWLNSIPGTPTQSVASADPLPFIETLEPSITVNVTGTTNFGTGTYGYDGQRLTLKIQNGLTIAHGARWLLNGAVNAVLSAGDTISFVSIASQWIETGRTSGGAWTTFTTTPFAASGSITSGTATVHYKKIGTFTSFTVLISITNNGTGAGTLAATMPFSCSKTAFAGREDAVTGKMLQGTMSGTTLSVQYYDNSYPGVSGGMFYLSGTAECT